MALSPEEMNNRGAARFAERLRRKLRTEQQVATAHHASWFYVAISEQDHGAYADVIVEIMTEYKEVGWRNTDCIPEGGRYLLRIIQ